MCTSSIIKETVGFYSVHWSKFIKFAILAWWRLDGWQNTSFSLTVSLKRSLLRALGIRSSHKEIGCSEQVSMECCIVVQGFHKESVYAVKRILKGLLKVHMHESALVFAVVVCVLNQRTLDVDSSTASVICCNIWRDWRLATKGEKCEPTPVPKVTFDAYFEVHLVKFAIYLNATHIL